MIRIEQGIYIGSFKKRFLVFGDKASFDTDTCVSHAFTANVINLFVPVPKSTFYLLIFLDK